VDLYNHSVAIVLSPNSLCYKLFFGKMLLLSVKKICVTDFLDYIVKYLFVITV